MAGSGERCADHQALRHPPMPSPYGGDHYKVDADGVRYSHNSGGQADVTRIPSRAKT
jgi:hypothetical protein